jgi:hypothetical protein
MAEYKDREHFIPLRKSELIDLLCSEKGMSAEDQGLFRQFCKLVTATCHLEYDRLLERSKDDYAPFDPDSDTHCLVKPSGDEKQRRLNELFRDFAKLLHEANFKHLTREEIEPGPGRVSELGLYLHVDWGCFEHIAVFARGELTQTRVRRRARRFFRTEEVEIPIHQRLALILKLKPSRRFSADVNTGAVYLKLFKDIPRHDVKMLLPTARVRLTYFDRGKIGVPLLSGLGLAAFNILQESFLLPLLAGALSPLALWGIATGAAGYGFRSYSGYTRTRQHHSLALTQSLYYQNLDSNAGVFVRLLDEAEEQECREAFLAYFFLWRSAGERGWTSAELDDYIEAYLERSTGLKLDFEIRGAIHKLGTRSIVKKKGERFCAVPIRDACAVLAGALHQ